MIRRLSNKHTMFIHGNENYTQVAVMKILYRQFLNKKLNACTTFYRASKHRPDTRTEITCTKPLVICTTQLGGGVFLGVRNCGVLIGLCK